MTWPQNTEAAPEPKPRGRRKELLPVGGSGTVSLGREDYQFAWSSPPATQLYGPVAVRFWPPLTLEA